LLVDMEDIVYIWRSGSAWEIWFVQRDVAVNVANQGCSMSLWQRMKLLAKRMNVFSIVAAVVSF